jgi:hypothetical protein
MEIIWDTRNPNKIFGTHKKDFRAFQKNMDLTLVQMRIIARKILENSRETLLIEEHILKDTHILKLNILGCDTMLAINKNFHRIN